MNKMFIQFEYFKCMMFINGFKLWICIVYRLFLLKVNKLILFLFFNEWVDYISFYVIDIEELFIIGDFNFYFDNVNDMLLQKFLSMLLEYGFI